MYRGMHYALCTVLSHLCEFLVCLFSVQHSYFSNHLLSFFVHQHCDATAEKVEDFDHCDDADAQTQTHQTADVGEDVEGVVARLLRDDRVFESLWVDVQLEHASSHLLFCVHWEATYIRECYGEWVWK